MTFFVFVFSILCLLEVSFRFSAMSKGSKVFYIICSNAHFTVWLPW